MFELPNYNLYSELRTNKRGGGVLLYIHKSVSFMRYSNLCTQEFECVTGELSINSRKFGLCAVYRPPDTSKLRFIKELSSVVSKHPIKQDCVILGDMNIDLKVCNPVTEHYLGSLCTLGFVNGINSYTRIEKYGNRISKSCIDHVFIRNTSTYNIFTSVVNTSPADHCITGCAITCALNKNDSHSPIQLITKIDNRRVHSELNNIDWSIPLQYSCPNKIVNYIHTSFNNVYDKCKFTISKSSFSKRKICPWANENLRKMCLKRDLLFSIWLKDENNPQKRLLYNRYRNKTNKYTNYIRNKQIMMEVTQNFKNTKKIWSIVNNLTGKIMECIENVLLMAFRTDPSTLANTFMTEFNSNIKNLSSPCDVPLLDKSKYEIIPDRSIRVKPAREDTVDKIIKQINDRKAPGYDGIRAKDVKYASANLIPIITHLINCCLRTGTYPDLLKIGVIRPIHKKGLRDDVNNYRPITILSCIDKILERYIGNEINLFIQTHGIINDKQYGFQKNKSTTQLLRAFTDEVNEQLNDKKHVLTLFIDFSKAFDMLRYETLFDKLSQNGIQGPLLKLLKNYHTNRHNTVKIKNEYSTLLPSTQGTAQGSIIGPTEYLLYVNDMSNVINSGSVYQFADDTCILVASKNLRDAEESLQRNFDKMCKWAHDVGLVINATKTKIVHIHSSHNKCSTIPTVIAHEHACLHTSPKTCKCPSLEVVDKHMYIGLIVDSRFCWGPHKDYVCNKLRSILGKLSILKYKLPYKTLRMLYMALADSVISYGLSSYGRTYHTYLSDIYKLQLRILKVITPKHIVKKFNKSDDDLFKHCNVMNVFNKVEFLTLTESNRPELLTEKKRPEFLRTIPLQNKYILPKCNNVYGMRVAEYLIPFCLNKLPEELQKLYGTGSKSYRYKCKRFLTQRL